MLLYVLNESLMVTFVEWQAVDEVGNRLLASEQSHETDGSTVGLLAEKNCATFSWTQLTPRSGV